MLTSIAALSKPDHISPMSIESSVYLKGGELSYAAPAMEREGIAHCSLLPLAGAVLAIPEPMLSRLVRGCIALAFTAGVRAVASPTPC